MAETKFDFIETEKKWQKRWAEMGLFKTGFNAGKEKSYVLSMYPYPSGVLHMGHVINYTISDVIVRYKLLQGYDVISPMGWDSFGLPAENAAIRTGQHPHDFTEKNITRMTEQMNRAGWGFDWKREVATSHVDYYKWNQWFFLKFLEKGLAEKKTAPVNWCDSCQTVLANEQVKDGECERCGSVVIQKDMSQWFFKMSQYSQRLLDGHAGLRGKWPDSVIAMQEEWIGRSEGARVDFTVKETGEVLPVFTTRPDTLFGVTFMSLAPEHPLIEKLVKGTAQEERVMQAVREMRAAGTSEKELADKEKVGINTGFHVINPVNGEDVELWVANFALMSYGTGAVMAVPAHDQRDFEFAKKYGIAIKVVINPADSDTLDPASMDEAFTTPGVLVNSGEFSGQVNTEAMSDIIAWLGKEGYGEGTINYRLRDWLISRQRYWGTPIPVIYCDNCGTVPVPVEDLPVVLPTDVTFSGDGNPLNTSASFINCTCPKCSSPARRETDTMDTFVDSSWYFLRFCDPDNEQAPFAPENIKKWMTVDQYVGGIEHATMHLIYARFFTMVLHDLGLLDFTEPFARLFCQGMVCKTAYRCENCKWLYESEVEFYSDADKSKTQGKVGSCKKCGLDGVTAEMTKISKTKLNVVDPDEMFDRVGTDAVRLYMLSDSPPDRMQIWSEAGLNGAWRTISRLHLTVMEWSNGTAGKLAPLGSERNPDIDKNSLDILRKTHQCIAAVTNSIEGGFHFNTAIARCNELINLFRNRMSTGTAIDGSVAREVLETVLRILSPITPHLCEEMWEVIGHTESIFKAGWPVAEKELCTEDTIEIPVQVNGKLKSKISVNLELTTQELEKIALADEKVAAFIGEKTIIKVIVVPQRMVNIVIKG